MEMIVKMPAGVFELGFVEVVSFMRVVDIAFGKDGKALLWNDMPNYFCAQKENSI